ncbi:MAG: 2-iminoacetate synthase ThiH [Rikenellaceae bacterium]
MFSEYIKQFSWEQTHDQIMSRTEGDVKRVLAKRGQLTPEDFMTLISPAAEPFLEQMAALSQRYTMERFGKTISLFIPLYLTNSCRNGCVYCGFNSSNHMKRTVLTFEEMENEFKAIKKLGPFDNLLMVTGENPAVAGVEYLAKALDIAKGYFSNLQIEVMPLSAEDYSTLVGHGLNGVICFQETYNREKYPTYHPKGMKNNFEWRVNGFDRMGQAEVHKIGMGVLIGLEDWRVDATMMMRHLRYLQKRYWKTKYSVNYPRMRKAENGGFQPNVIISDREFVQLTLATRIFDHDVDLSLSTRELPHMRDNLAPLGITTMSAESKTEPGGYYSYPQALEQFQVSDERRAEEIVAALKRVGREAVWKDWDRSLDIMK